MKYVRPTGLGLFDEEDDDDDEDDEEDTTGSDSDSAGYGGARYVWMDGCILCMYGMYAM